MSKYNGDEYWWDDEIETKKFVATICGFKGKNKLAAIKALLKACGEDNATTRRQADALVDAFSLWPDSRMRMTVFSEYKDALQDVGFIFEYEPEELGI
jgi:hypothetical protein